MKVLIDNGHGENTPGKRSPDGRLREWAYSREIADMVVSGLRKRGIDAERIVKEDTDVPLSERCRRANAVYKETGKKAILISIHCNAAGNGGSWLNARGWSVFVSNNASANSKKLATCLGEAAEVQRVTIRKQTPKLMYWEQNLAICRDSNCPAVLTENFFQDNKEDVDFLLSEEGKRTIVSLHVKGICKYLKV
jgi:N-acetylmuramoyl-L-alanine amidase|nr:MAG TPA: Cell wall hydrolase autolysin [Caudoviricetes sp.]